ncbi:DMT family transporter [Thalassovita sp.]|uniref:DMT family transporter n=1 Tax=Thalassovita sp. TaxID=1979401 RepID=UPI002B274EBB|nr:SMR family transporter [Thalassovita sp.]
MKNGPRPKGYTQTLVGIGKDHGADSQIVSKVNDRIQCEVAQALAANFIPKRLYPAWLDECNCHHHKHEGYAASFHFMALVLKLMPVVIVYAIWSGVGIALILIGILVIQLFSKMATH